ncbi:Uncharacterized protein APZ42_027623 [Daphnia magna]|uniref:Uncharacterized protein n=1 Tax=Daphnia magna TaxID=35525 RepID=A0A162D8N1_9CRUS|nr:Uncharacterized protein APZ42_027623 [Daphnia magna]
MAMLNDFVTVLNFTCNVWTSLINNAILGVTAYWISQKWNSKDVVIELWRTVQNISCDYRREMKQMISYVPPREQSFHQYENGCPKMDIRGSPQRIHAFDKLVQMANIVPHDLNVILDVE